MGEPRKVFRIEEMAVPRRAPSHDDAAPPHDAAAPPHDAAAPPGLDEIMQELGALRSLMAAAAPRPSSPANALRHDEAERLAAKLRQMRSTIIGAEPEQAGRNGARAPATRIAHELEAVMKGSEQATQKILAAAEEIDQAANNLSASLKDESEQGLAQDIRDRVIQIFEACNFQDLTSQRVAKVMTTLGRIEVQISRTLDELTRNTAPPAHGPRLDDDGGHASQSEVDSMFGNWSSGSGR